ncbi:MAG: ABC transporter permease subunit [Acidobacteria bacterium]|nr:ABC transporter permease subunit [Acidobacteriota bacterium]
MNLQRLGIVARKELVDAFRDRRAVGVLAIGSLVGPALIAFSLNAQIRRQSVAELRVPVTGAQYAPLLVDWLRQQPDVTVVEGPRDLAAAQAAVRAGDEDFVLAIAEDYGEDFAALRPGRVRIVRDSAGRSSGASRDRLRRLVGRYSEEIGWLRLVARGVDPKIASAVSLQDLELSTAQQRAGRILAMIPIMALLAAFSTALQIATDSTAGERERGALEALLLNPVPRLELVVGKWLAATIFALAGMVATLGLMAAALAMVPFAEAGVRFSFTVTQGLQWLVAMLPAGLLAPAIEIYLASFARTFKEAQQYMGFVIMVPMLALVGALTFPEATGVWLAPAPILGQFELAKEILAGESPAAIWYVLGTFSTLACAALLLGLTARLFRSEKFLLGR